MVLEGIFYYALVTIFRLW